MAYTVSVYQPAWTKGADHTASLQATINAIAAKGVQAYIDLMGRVWNISGAGLTGFDPSLMRMGSDARATIVLATGMKRGITVSEKPGRGDATLVGGSAQTIFENIYFVGDDTPDQHIIHFENEPGDRQEFSGGTIVNCEFKRSYYPIFIGKNAFFVEAVGCFFNETRGAVFGRSYDSLNSGEKTSFTRCKFANGRRIIDTQFSNSADFLFYDCSFDFPYDSFAYFNAGVYNFVLCHFEGRTCLGGDPQNPASIPPFRGDNGFLAIFTMCNISWKPENGIPSPDYLCVVDGNGGNFVFENCWSGDGFPLFAVDANGVPTICNKSDNVSILLPYAPQGFSGMKGRKAWNVTEAGWAGAGAVSAPVDKPTSIPSSTPAQTGTGTPSDGSTKLRIASAPNAIAYNARQATIDTLDDDVTFPVFFGPDGALSVAYEFLNDFINSENFVGNVVTMDGLSLMKPDGTSPVLKTDSIAIPWRTKGRSTFWTPDMFGLSIFPANEIWIGKARVSVSAAGLYIPGSLKVRDKQRYSCFFTNPLTGAKTPNYNESAIPQVIGLVPSKTRTFGIFGDSWNRGNDEVSANSQFALGDFSDIGEKAMVNPKTGVVQPFVNLSAYGYAMAPNYDPSKDPRMQFASLIDEAIDASGYNEVASLDGIKVAHLALWAALKAAGVKKIWKTAIFANGLQTSDGFVTLAGQTLTGPSALGGLEDQMLAWLQTKVADGTLAGIIPYISLQDATEPHKVKVNGTANWLLSVSNHPTPTAGVAAGAADYRTALGLA